MGIGLSVAEALRNHGHECVHLIEQSLERLPDDKILVKARDEKRVIITHDLDFSRLLALSNAARPSVITFRLDNMQPQSVLAKLNPLIAHFQTDLESGVAIVVTDRNIRMRRLPIVPPNS